MSVCDIPVHNLENILFQKIPPVNIALVTVVKFPKTSFCNWVQSCGWVFLLGLQTY